MMQIAENFRGRKAVEKNVEKTFADCSLVLLKDATLTNFVEKAFAISHKSLIFCKVFFPSKVFRYTVYCLEVGMEHGSEETI